MSQENYIHYNPIQGLNRLIDIDNQMIEYITTQKNKLIEAPEELVNVYMRLQKINQIHILATTYVRDCLIAHKAYNPEILVKFHSKANQCEYEMMELIQNMVEQEFINEEQYIDKTATIKKEYERTNERFGVLEAYATGKTVLINFIKYTRHHRSLCRWSGVVGDED